MCLKNMGTAKRLQEAVDKAVCTKQPVITDLVIFEPNSESEGITIDMKNCSYEINPELNKLVISPN